MGSPEILKLLDEFMSKEFILDTNGIISATYDLNYIFQTLDTISNMKQLNKQRIKKYVWFDNECKCIRKEL